MKLKTLNHRDIQLVVAIGSMALAVGVVTAPFQFGILNWLVAGAIMIGAILVEVRLEREAEKAEKAKLLQRFSTAWAAKSAADQNGPAK